MSVGTTVAAYAAGTRRAGTGRRHCELCGNMRHGAIGAEPSLIRMTGPTPFPSSTPRTQLPPRVLPVLYFGVAHVALALAFAAVALDPRGVSGFFYHSQMLAIVHLISHI